MFGPTDIYKFAIPGHGDRFADPLLLRRKVLAASHGRAWEYAKAAKALEAQLAAVGTAEGAEADARRAEFSTRLAEVEGHLAETALDAFGLVPVDAETGFGATETVALGLLYDFLGWLEGKGGRPGN